MRGTALLGSVYADFYKENATFCLVMKAKMWRFLRPIALNLPLPVESGERIFSTFYQIPIAGFTHGLYTEGVNEKDVRK